MSRTLFALCTCAGLSAMAASLPMTAFAKGVVEVKFIEPEKFADIGLGASQRENVLKSLGDFMRGFAKELPDGQTLALDVLDIDLAGRLEHWHRGEMRVLRGGADWPHMTIRYTLQSSADGATIKSGKADLADMNYLQSTRDLRTGDTQYSYEKRMVQRWFRTVIAPVDKPQP